MMGLLDGKVVLVTGAGRGQGRAHAVVSAREGADVIAVDTDATIDTVPYELSRSEDLEETVRLVEEQGRRALGVTADVRSQADLDSAVARGLELFGGIDCLIANAGIWTLGRLWELSEAMWQDTIDVNLTGVYRTVRAVLPHMIDRRSGSIVLTASVNGVEPSQLAGHYAASKHGVLGLMKSVALEGGPYGVRCNAVNPGVIDTGMINWQGAYDLVAGRPGEGTPEDMVRAGYRYHLLPEGPMDPEVVARVALFLNSDLASLLTGVAIPVEGGHLLLAGCNHSAAGEEQAEQAVG
jgi:SDR family mycofactocin-dependent oxidoreductase